MANHRTTAARAETLLTVLDADTLDDWPQLAVMAAQVHATLAVAAAIREHGASVESMWESDRQAAVSKRWAGSPG